MAQPPQMTRVDVDAATLICLPPDHSCKFPGLNLGPDGNNVPTSFVTLLETGKTSNGKALKRGIVADWARLKASGVITVHPPEVSASLVTQAEGPAAPAHLRALGPKAAIAVVNTTSDPELIKLWLGKEGRPAVLEALETRLASLGATAA